jgi:hypothetical protein
MNPACLHWRTGGYRRSQFKYAPAEYACRQLPVAGVLLRVQLSLQISDLTLIGMETLAE